MRIQDSPPIHLTYCLNVHPGETLAENLAAIREKAMRVKQQVAPREPFGLGLRLSAAAVKELAQPPALNGLKSFLQASGMYAFTINGFPYGRFHGTRVKENVYAPDWRTAERRDYTKTLADILAALLPEGVGGSISTVPVSYKPWMKTEDDVSLAAANLAETAAHLDELRRRTGKDICLALEPEPDCFIETTEEAVAFFQRVLDRSAAKHLAGLTGQKESAARRTLRRHVGVCLDTAHAAVEFEDLAGSLRRLAAAGVRVGKIQLSSALCLKQSAMALKQLSRFLDETYLHQVKVHVGAGQLASYPDLPQALEDRMRPLPGEDELRCHFHVPLFFEAAGELQSTSDLLDEDFWRLVRAGASEHLEIETYTFDVLPDSVRPADVTESIAREYRWVLERFGTSRPPPETRP